MTERTKEKIRLLKQEFRANMNGMASASMRDAGIAYRVNFGIELPRLSCNQSKHSIPRLPISGQRASPRQRWPGWRA